jgi:hypothetical protein
VTVWYDEAGWHDDESDPSKKTIPEKKIDTYRIAEFVLPINSPDYIYILKLECGHEVVELVKNKGIPSGYTRLCEKCKNAEL